MNDTLKANLRQAFTEEDFSKILKMLSDGYHDQIAAEVNIQNQHQEALLQELLDSVRGPKQNPEGSRVRAEIERLMAIGEDPLANPEKEKQWQELLDREAKGETVDLSEVSPAPEAESTKTLTKEEIVKKLEELEVDFDPTLKKSELKQLLEKAQV